MTKAKQDLFKYLENNNNANLLNQQIQEIEEDIKLVEINLEKAEQTNNSILETNYLNDLHNLRIKKLGLEADLNAVEKNIIQFELARELAE